MKVFIYLIESKELRH